MPSLNHDAKSVLWVDAFVCYRDPTMRQLLHTLPELQAAGWTVKVWCLESDLSPGKVEQVFLPAPRWLGPLALLYFSTVVNLYGFWRWLRGAPRPAAIIHATCATYLGSDLASVHFLNCVWLSKQLELGFGSWKERLLYLLHAGGAVFERLHWWSPALCRVLAVSDSVANEVRQRLRRPIPVETLPNAYDDARFNREIRALHRAPYREKLGYRPDEVVFAFVSLGHHQRKGFWLAVAALAQLRSNPALRNARFLVVGGRPATLARLQQRLSAEFPDWPDWITFTGQQNAVEHYLAAADAFLYPSYFEAFCLAEIEAAAMGLPLLLTRHHGSEMILEEGVNGLWLEFDPAAIAATLRRFMQLGPSAFRYSIGAALTRPAYARRLLDIYERMIASR